MYATVENKYYPLLANPCGNVINNKIALAQLTNNNPNLPFAQTWASPEAAVIGLGMRPIVNPIEYFNNIREYLSNVMIKDSAKAAEFSKMQFQLIDSYGVEPLHSFLQSIKLDVVQKLNVIMANTCGEISMFKNYNPLPEGFVINDIKITSYMCTGHNTMYYHTFTFAAVNTTRYNTISFKGSVYQDTTKIMSAWNDSINKVMNSKDLLLNSNLNVSTDVYINFLDFLNDTSLKNVYSDLSSIPNSDYSSLEWFKQGSLENAKFTNEGYYDESGNIVITDSGPENFESLVKELEYYYK